MQILNTALAGLLAATGLGMTSAYAAPNWVGSADYYGVETVGPFSTYDFGTGAVLVTPTATAGDYNGYYQAAVTNHELNGTIVSAPLLNSGYELTVAANFTQTVTPVSGATSEINVTGGSFNLYLDTAATDSSFSGDSGFTNGTSILSGTIISGTGAATSAGGGIFGVTDITVSVDSYDTSVFEPDTIKSAGGIFTLRLGSPLDAAFLGDIENVQGNAVAVAGAQLFAADGNVALAVPEAETYAMMLAGLGLVGFMVSRRRAA